MEAAPLKEHQWLQRLVGEWTCETECSMGPDQPPSRLRGTEVVRSLGGLWVVCEGRSETPGGETATSIVTLGYDPVKKRYLGTFVASVMTHLWVYDGALDEAGTGLTLDTEGPSFTGEGHTAKYQDIIEFKSDDHRTLNSRALGDDGQWHHFMTANYRRSR